MALAKSISAGFLGLALTILPVQAQDILPANDLNEGLRSITVTVPYDENEIFEGLQSAIKDFSVNSCVGVPGRECPEGNPVIGVDTIVTIPTNCQLAPCLPGCSGAGTLMCLPPFSRNSGQLLRTSEPNEQVQHLSTFPAQGGGSVAVITYGDGSHEAYFYSEGGFSIIESGGGGGGHQQLLDDIKTQWE